MTRIPPFRGDRRPAARPARTPSRRRLLGAEKLEARWLLTTAAVTHLFRDDDFTMAGSFAYNLVQTDYKDSIPSGQYSGSGHVFWQSPTIGQATFQGVATGQGTDQVLFAGSFRNCSRYNIRDEGTLSLQIDAGTKKILVDDATPTATQYTSYTDLTGGFCAAGDPRSVFFGGLPSRYGGSYDASTSKASVSYTDTSNGITVTSPATNVTWADTAATDFAISLVANNGAPALPQGWEPIEQTPTEPNNSLLDANGGSLELNVAVTGKPVNAPAAGPTTLVGTVALAWVSDQTGSPTVQAIPIDSTDGVVGLYWNSNQLFAQITNLPAAPSWARFVRATVSASGFTESTTSNNVAYIGIKTFNAQDGSTPGTLEDEFLDGFNRSLLGPTDVARYPDVTVLAYAPKSRMGADVTVTSDRGAFTYDPTSAPLLQALSDGETTVDVIDFMALESGSFSDRAEHRVTVVGVNDPPTPIDDAASARENSVLFLQASTLVANDFDIDHGDQVHFSQVETFSVYGAEVTLLSGGVIRYDPTQSSFLRTMTTGESTADTFAYRVVDDNGVEAWGFVTVTVTGSNDPPEILPVDPIVLAAGATSGQTVVQARDWESEPSDLTIQITHDASPLLDSNDVVIGGVDDIRTVTVTPNTGLTGRVRFTAQVTTTSSETASADFYLVVGTASDSDLDGVADATESIAPFGGDANINGIPDQFESNLASLKTANNTQWIWVGSSTTTALSNVAAETPSAANGVATGASFPWGGVGMEIVVATGGTATLSIRSDSTAQLNAYYQWVPGVAPGTGSWEWLGWNGLTGALPFSDHVDLIVKDGGRGDADGVANGRIVVHANPANVAAPWHNRALAEDVNNDSLVTPRDALLVINYLNSDQPKTLPSVLQSGLPTPDFLDVFADNQIVPRDALIVINRLNGVASGEGETLDAAIDLAIPTIPLLETAVSAPAHQVVATSIHSESIWQAAAAAFANVAVQNTAAVELASVLETLKDDQYTTALDALMDEWATV